MTDESRVAAGDVTLKTFKYFYMTVVTLSVKRLCYKNSTAVMIAKKSIRILRSRGYLY